MITPQIANYNVCKAALHKGAYEDIIVNNYYSDSDKQELWYYEEQLELNVLKKMPNVIPAFEIEPLQRWLREIKNLSVLVIMDSNLTGYVPRIWKTEMRNEPILLYESTISYPLYTMALNQGLLEALTQLPNEN